MKQELDESESISCSLMVFDSAAPGAHQALLSMGFPRQEYWRGLPFPSPGEELDNRFQIFLIY